MSSVRYRLQGVAAFCVLFFLSLPGTFASSHNDQRSKDHRAPIKITVNSQNHTFVVQDVVKGMDVHDYLLTAEKGQILTLSLSHNGGHSLADVIVFSINGNPPKYQGFWQEKVLDESGEYLIRVLLPRAYARRHTKHSYRLIVKLDEKKPVTQEDSSI